MEIKVRNLTMPPLRCYYVIGTLGMLEASRWVAITGKLFASLAFGFIYQFTTELYPTVARYCFCSVLTYNAFVTTFRTQGNSDVNGFDVRAYWFNNHAFYLGIAEDYTMADSGT